MMDLSILNAMVLDLDPEAVDGRLISVEIPDGIDVPASDAELRCILTAGMVDLVVEAAAGEEGAAQDLAGRARWVVEAKIAPTRFALFERTTNVEHLERAARMRGFEIGQYRSWLVPRLEEDIDAYRARIAAVRRVLEGR